MNNKSLALTPNVLTPQDLETNWRWEGRLPAELGQPETSPSSPRSRKGAFRQDYKKRECRARLRLRRRGRRVRGRVHPRVPVIFLYWGYRHISKDARNVDSSLYHDMVSRIQHEAARDAVISGAKSSALFALHLLEEMFGRNAATQTIDKHLEHSSILYRADLGPADFAMRMRRARAGGARSRT